VVLQNYIPVVKPLRTVEPTIEPVTLNEAKWQVSVDESDSTHDAALLRLIEQARELVESDTGMILGLSTFSLSLPHFYDAIVLPLRPVVEILSITYLDAAGDSQTLSTDIYELDNGKAQPAILRKYLATWPATRGDENAVTISFTAGHEVADEIPATLKSMVLLDVARNFLDREGAMRFDGAYESLNRRHIRPCYMRPLDR